MVHRILMLLSYGKKIEKYALTGQAVARAVKQLHEDLTAIWGEDSSKIAPKKASSTERKVLKNEDKKDDNVQEG